MISIQTSNGIVKWQPGTLDETANIIFSYGRSAIFALILYLYKQDLIICYFQNEDGTPDHFFCADNQYWYDILGKHSIYETKFSNVVENISIGEIRQHINNGDEYLVYSIINEYVLKTFE
jgi:hypothetical protein